MSTSSSNVFSPQQQQQQQQVFLFRRMSPQEDLLATLLGIDVLVRQRQELVDRLIGHHGRLARRDEIGALADFSREIDRIMKMRGFTVMTPVQPRKSVVLPLLTTPSKRRMQLQVWDLDPNIDDVADRKRHSEKQKVCRK